MRPLAFKSFKNGNSVVSNVVYIYISWQDFKGLKRGRFAAVCFFWDRGNGKCDALHIKAKPTSLTTGQEDFYYAGIF